MSGALRQKDAQIWARHPEDWYVEPEWCSRRLFDVEPFEGSIYDPACGSGRIVNSALLSGLNADGGDIVKRYIYATTEDFLSSSAEHENIVSNPPFGIADGFTEHALRLAQRKVAMLLPTKWMNGAKRGAWLETTPLSKVWLLAPRPSMPPGTVIEAGEKPGNGTVDFAWFVWEHGHAGAPTLGWLRREA